MAKPQSPAPGGSSIATTTPPIPATPPAAPTDEGQKDLHELLRVLETHVGLDDAAGTRFALSALVSIQEGMSLGLTVVEAHKSRILYASPAFLQMVGRTAEEVLSLASTLSLVPPEERPMLEERLNRPLRGPPQAGWYETRILHKKGHAIEVDVSTILFQFPRAPIFFTLTRDVSRRKKAMRSLAEAQKLAHIGSWEWDLEAARVEWSDEMFRIYGLAPEAFGGRLEDLWRLVHPEDRTQFEHETREAASSGGSFSVDYRIVRPDGSVRFIHSEGGNVPEIGGRGRFAGTAQDVTDLRFAEQSLQALTRELLRSNEELEQFAYVASHDLREPLRVISGYLGMLDRRFAATLSDEAQTFVRAAVAGAARMDELISHLLAYSRVGTAGAAFASADAQECFDEAVANLRPSIEENQGLITHDPLPTVFGDRSQLVQLFQNLIGNAVKFRRDVAPQVHVRAERRAKDWVLSVRDNGIGIRPQDFERVFELFQRLHPAQAYPGSGIGLSIARKIVERHGGRIWLESKPGQGSTFFFSLPVPK